MNNLGCCFLDSGIDFESDSVRDCCISHNDGRGLPLLINDYHGEMIDWNKLFDKKAERIAAQKEKTIYECDGCYHLGVYTFRQERKISDFHFTHCRVCNAKCIYCSDMYSAGEINYNTLPVIKDLINKGFYKPGGEATFQGGEPAIMLDFDGHIRMLTENGTVVRVHTNAIRYSSAVEAALKQNKGTVVISLDSGTSETYKIIKQTDMFGKVSDTIKKYASANSDNIILKYIIIPGVNDNIKEIDLFFNIVKKYGIKTAALDLEVQYARKYENKYVSPHIFLLSDYFEQKAKELNIEVLIYSFISYVRKNRTIRKPSFIKNKFLYNLYINCNTKINKNIKYER